MEKVNFNSKEFENFLSQKIVELADRLNRNKYLNLRDAANILDVSQRTLTHLIQDGYVNCYRIPSKMGEKKNYRFKLSDIEDFMNQNKVVSIDNIVKNSFRTKNIERKNINKMVKDITANNK